MVHPTIEVWRDSTAIAADQRTALIGAFDQIADRIWDKEAGMYRTRESFYFNEASGVALAYDCDQLIAYSIYRRVETLGKNVIQWTSTTVSPAYQNRGLRSRFIKEILSAEHVNGRQVLLGTRTRNPINWHVFSRCCDEIVPDFRSTRRPNAELIDIGVSAAAKVWPSCSVERPTMIMRKAFDWLRFLEQPMHHDSAVNREFFRDLSEVDGYYVIGRPGAALLAR